MPTEYALTFISTVVEVAILGIIAWEALGPYFKARKVEHRHTVVPIQRPRHRLFGTNHHHHDKG